MVSPIDYTMNVLNPIQGYMQGMEFGENVLTARQGRELAQSQEGRAQETFAMQKEDRERRIAQERAAAARAQQQRAQAEASRAALLSYLDDLEAGTATPEQLRRTTAMFPQVSEQLQAFSSQVGQERLNNEMGFSKKLAFAISKGNIEAAKQLLTMRAEAEGDPQTSDIARAQLMQLEQNPNSVLVSTQMKLLEGLGFDEYSKFDKILGGQEQPAEGASPLGKIAQDVNAGLIPQSVLDAQVRVEERAGKEGLTLQQSIAEEARLRGEYSKRTEDLSAAERNFSVIETSASDNSGAGDIALVTSFMKMLDPGSVVRETEFATAANAGGLLARLGTIANKVENGQFLTPQQRTDFQRLANKYLTAAREQEGRVQQSYQRIVDNYGLDPVNVFGARAVTADASPNTVEEPASGTLPQSFITNPTVISSAEKYGVTPEAIWERMNPEQRSAYE